MSGRVAEINGMLSHSKGAIEGRAMKLSAERRSTLDISLLSSLHSPCGPMTTGVPLTAEQTSRFS